MKRHQPNLLWDRKLLTIFLSASFISHGFAAPPIEGGRLVNSTDPLTKSIVQISQGFMGASCTATRISDEWLLTAAHCVLGQNALPVPISIVTDGMAPQSTSEEVFVHPSYLFEKANAKKVNDLECKKCTQFDVALVRIKKTDPAPESSYLPIVNEKNIPRKRESVTLAGYGANELFWNGTDMEPRSYSFGR